MARPRKKTAEEAQQISAKPEGLQSAEAATPPVGTAGRSYIVGIGASAGGLEALSALIGRLKPGLSASYVVAQHLSPARHRLQVPPHRHRPP